MSLKNTELNDRVLWIDGECSVDNKRLCEFILNGYDLSKFSVNEIDNDVKLFNMYNKDGITLSLKTEVDERKIDKSLTIPESYKTIDIFEYIFDKFSQKINSGELILSEDEIILRAKRIKKEIKLIKLYNLEDLIRTVIYIIDKFDENDVIWGTGRGSSCCLYCLYVLGLHEVDSVEYDLDLNEFFKSI